MRDTVVTLHIVRMASSKAASLLDPRIRGDDGSRCYSQDATVMLPDLCVRGDDGSAMAAPAPVIACR
jgi:hypothetical protein